jgi:hypothetical protein
MKSIPAALASLMLLSACQKDGSIAADPARLTVTISSPAPRQIFRSGDTVLMAATLRYPSQLHGYELKLTDSATGTIVYDIARHVHSDRFTISERWISTASVPSVIRLTLTASIDHEGGTASEARTFTVLP